MSWRYYVIHVTKSFDPTTHSIKSTASDRSSYILPFSPSPFEALRVTEAYQNVASLEFVLTYPGQGTPTCLDPNTFDSHHLSTRCCFEALCNLKASSRGENYSIFPYLALGFDDAEDTHLR